MIGQEVPEKNRSAVIWRRLLRALWLALTLFYLAIFLAGLAPLFGELSKACEAETCSFQSLTPQEAKALDDLGLSMTFYAGLNVGVELFAAGATTLLAALIYWRRFDDRVGILVAFFLVLFGLTFIPEADNVFVRLNPILQGPHDAVTVMGSVAFLAILFLFPDGRFVPRWTRLIVIVLFGIALIDPLLQTLLFRVPTGHSIVLFLMMLLCWAVGTAAQVYRYRNVSSLAQRQQTKWVVLGLSVFLIAALVFAPFGFLFPLQPGIPRLLFKSVGSAAVAIMALSFPLSIAFSIFRYRLWDIDVVIRRTVVYGILTLFLALIYLGSTILLQAIFTAVSGQRSPVAIVISTLVIAALFQRVRLYVQDVIDRRFYRRKYDAALTLAAFAETARSDVDLDSLEVELLRTVQETVQPASVTLWLKEPDAGSQVQGSQG